MSGKRKAASVLMCCALLAGTLSGCGTKSTDADGVSVANVWSNDSHSKLEMMKLVDEFNKTTGEKDGIKVIYTVKEGDYNQIVDMAITSDNAPEMFVSGRIDKYSENGNIVPLEELPGGTEYVAEYDQQLLGTKEFTATDGKVYRVPFNITSFGLVYNKDMFKRYGIVDENGEAKPPETFDELREYAKKMTDVSKQDYGIIFPMKWALFYNIDVAALGLSSGGTTGYDPTRGVYDYSVMKPVFEMYLGIKEDGSYFPGSEGLDNDSARAQFSERNIAMKLAGSYDVGVFNTQFPAKCDWGVAPLPVADKNNRYKQKMTLSGYLVVNRAAMDKVSPDKLMTVFKWFHSDEVLTSLYEKSLTIPYSDEIIKKANPTESRKGWKEFADLVSVSYIDADPAPVDLQGGEGMDSIFNNYIWSGDISIDDGIKRADEVMNEGLKRRFESDSKLDINRYIKPEWNIKLQ